jgi:sugar phosphate isomerase/epimerase
MKLSICIQTPEVPKTVPVALITGELEEKIAKASAWGADAVEFMTVEPRRLDWNAIAAALNSEGLQAAAVASGAMAFAAGITLLHPEADGMTLAKSRLYDLIDMAASLGAPVVTIGSFRGRLALRPTGDGRERLCAILREAGDYAHEHGVCLALEAINRYEADFLHTAEQCLDFVTEVDRPAVGVLLDTFQMNIEEASRTRPFELVFAQGKLFHVHLGDNNRLPPGQGLIDFEAVVQSLARLDYTGSLSAELLAKPDADTAARMTIAHMRPLLDRVMDPS